MQANQGIGINGTACTVTVEDTVVGPTNNGGGLRAAHSTLVLRNSIVRNNGSNDVAAPSKVGGVLVSSQAGSKIASVTVVGNKTGTEAGGIACVLAAIP